MMCKTALRVHGRERLRTALLGVALIGRSRNQLVDHTQQLLAKSDSTHLTRCDILARADLHDLACWDLSPLYLLDVHQPIRMAQDSAQLYCCLMDSLTQKGRNMVRYYKSAYTFNSLGAAVPLLKIIIHVSGF
eukprot:scaffold10988_cov59-Cylindrotheca_fusiformis.AAC.2